MNRTKEEACYDLYRYANNYFQGYENDTATGKAYVNKLSEIKLAYSNIRRNRWVTQTVPDVQGEIRTLAAAALGLLAWFVIFQTMEENSNVRIAYIIALCVVMHICTKNSWLSIVPFLIIFIGSFMGLTQPLVLVYLAAAAAYGAVRYLRKKKRHRDVNHAYRTALASLERLQKEMTAMLPQIRQDLQNYEKKWFAENETLLDSEDHKDFLGDFFPKGFWWQVSLKDMDTFRSIVTCDRYGDWETKLVPRENGTEFDGLTEYTPLFHQGIKLEGKLSDYYPPSQGFLVYDLISRLTIVSASAQTVQYKVPAHSDLEQISAYMSVIHFASGVDKAYERGEISTNARDRLANEAFGLGLLAGEYAEAQKTENRTEYIPLHNHANFWSGQVALKPVRSNGEVYYMIEYYTCQLPHLLENLQALSSLKIAGIDYSAWDCNPFFLAEFYSCFPYAM